MSRAVTLILAFCAFQVAGQPGTGPPLPPDRGNGLIMGRVIDGGTGRPVANTFVSINVGTNATVLTDETGRFLFEGLPRAQMTLFARKAGYAISSYGQSVPGSFGHPLNLAPGQRLMDVVLRIWRLAAITGRVVDESGDPVAGLPVNVYPRTLVAGRFVINTTTPTMAYTDDRGMYRLPRLQPGAYVVGLPLSENSVPMTTLESYLAPTARNEASSYLLMNRGIDNAGMSTALPGSLSINVVDGMARLYARNTAVPPAPDAGGTVLAYQPAYYPAANVPSMAQPIDVSPGDERNGIDFQLRLAPATRVSGVVIGPDGPAPIGAIWLVPANAIDLMTTELSVARTLSDATGAFTFPAVLPGRYEARVVTTIDGASYWARTPVIVGESRITDLQIRVQRGFRISGHADTSDTGAVSPPRSGVRFERADGGDVGATVTSFAADGTFVTPEMLPGRYVVRITGISNPWSATVRDRDISVAPIEIIDRDLGGVEIVFRRNPSQVFGTVRRTGEIAEPDAAVLAFPANPQLWTEYGRTPRALQRARVAEDGSYSIALPEGQYHVIAIRDDAVVDWQEPQTLQRLAGAAGAPVVLQPNTSVRHDLTISAIR